MYHETKAKDDTATAQKKKMPRERDRLLDRGNLEKAQCNHLYSLHRIIIIDFGHKYSMRDAEGPCPFTQDNVPLTWWNYLFGLINSS